MTYHIQIAQERRVSTPEQPRPLAIPVGTSAPTGNMVDGFPEYAAGPVQLHTHTDADLRRQVEYDTLPPDFSDPQFVMVAEWDGQSPYVIQHKGDYSARTMEYAGWPDITKEQYDAIPAADTPA